MMTALPAAAATEVGQVEAKSVAAEAVGSMELCKVKGGSYASGEEEKEITVRVDLAVLHCPLCSLPLKPPVFQCQIGHLACGTCRARLSTNQCRACVRGDGAYARCPGLDIFFRAVRVPCPYDAHGCRRRVAYFDAADHARGCPSAPCSCPEPGCAFLGSPAALLGHVDAAHARPATSVRYGAARGVSLSLPLPPASRRWHALVAEEDRAVFLLSLSALGSGAAAGAGAVVSLVCVRASSGAAAAPQYACRIAVDRPSDDGDGMVRAAVMESMVTSSALSGGGTAVPDHGVFVHQRMLSGDELALNVRISRLPPAGAAAAGTTGKSSPRSPLQLEAPSSKPA
ncbi:hypothetical protein EJB05_31848, partial [Eragrostis curvula]